MTAHPLSPEPLVLTITADSGLAYQISLVEFSTGGAIDNVAPKARYIWGGDYQGRPAFAEQIARLFRQERFEPKDCRSVMTAFRSLFRYLDAVERDGHARVITVADLTDSDGVPLHEWLSVERKSQYKRLYTLVIKLRTLYRLQPLFWPVATISSFTHDDLIEDEAIAALFKAVRRKAMQVKDMFRTGLSLAAAGRDPRIDTRVSMGWDSAENRSWLIAELTRHGLPSKYEFQRHSAYWGFMGAGREGPAFLAPNMRNRGREGVVGNLRWHHPTFQDTALFLILFIIGTGWNISTALSLDVSEEDSWCQEHPQNADYSVIHAYKGRSGQFQHVPVLRAPEWHPYQIVRYMIHRTEALRQTVRAEHRRACKTLENNPSELNAGRVAAIERRLRSPWLYHTVNHTSRVSTFSESDHELTKICRSIAIEARLTETYPSLMSFTLSMARDAWINHVFRQSGYQVVWAQFAAQHRDASTLRQYLHAFRYRERSEVEVRKVLDGSFAEISNGKPLNPTRLALLVANGTISAEQERRLSDHKQRTRVGLGCLDPTNPPAHIEPNHVDGALCTVQRCTGCQHGIVFDDSLPMLTRAYAELLHLRGFIPYASWLGSTFEAELTSIEATLAMFDDAIVKTAVDAWKGQLERGEIRIHDTYPGE